MSYRDSVSYQIYVMNADGSAPTRLTHTSSHEFDPSWSSDGGRIVFSSARDGYQQIYVMNADGSAQTPLTTGTAAKRMPRWRP